MSKKYKANKSTARDGWCRNLILKFSLFVFFVFTAIQGYGQNISISNASQPEGTALVFTVSTNFISVSDIDIPYQTNDGTALLSNNDYVDNDNTVTILAFTLSATITVNTIDDSVFEPNEILTVDLGTPSSGTVTVSQGIGTIVNNDASEIAMGANIILAEGNSGSTLYGFTANRTGDVSGAASATYVVTGTGANPAAATDFAGGVFPSGTATFNPGATIANIPINVNGDVALEPTETFTVTLSSPVNATLGANTATGTITNDDSSVSLGAGIVQNEGNSGTTAYNFTVTRTGVLSGVASVEYAITGTGANPAVAADFQGAAFPTGTANFTAGASSANIQVNVNGDVTVENDETFLVTLSNPINTTIGTATTTGTITNDDQNIISMGSGVNLAEGNSGTTAFVFNVTRSGDISGAASASWAVTGSGANAANAADFVGGPLPSGTATFAAASAGTTITVNVSGDVNIESTETFTVTLSNPSVNSTIGTATAIGTIANDDNCDAGATAPTINAGVPTTFCDNITQSLSDYSSSTAPAGSTRTWSSDPNPLNTGAHFTPAQVSATLTLTGTFYVFFYDATHACASPTNQIQITLNTTPTNVQGVGGERCGPGTVNLTASSATSGSTFNWYTALSGGTLAFTGNSINPNLTVTTTYYLEATRNGCASSPRIAVEATVVPEVSSGTPTDGSACSIAANGLSIIDLDDRLAGEDAGSWAVTTDPSGTVTILSGNIVNFQGKADGNYVFTYTTTGALAPCVNQSSAVTISVNNCDIDTDLDGLFDGPEANLGTDPNNPDTDEDGINDGTEVGPDVANPLDGDGDGIIDALDSNILDSDNDGVVDQLDPGNLNPCLPDNSHGLCDTDGDGITDGQEIADGTNPFDACDPNLTPDCSPPPIDIELLKTVDNENAAPGAQVVFTVTANNLSDGKVLGIKIAELLESGFEYVAPHTASLGTYDPLTGEWAIDEMGGLQSATLEITANVLEGGIYSNTAALLESFPIDDNPANDSTTITLNVDLPEGVDLLVEKTALSIRPLVGDQVVFTIKVTNISIDATISQIQILDLNANDPGFVYVSHTADLGTYDPMTATWLIPQLVKDQEARLLITVQVPIEGIYPNTARLVGSSPGDSNQANNESTVVVTVFLPTEADDGFVFNEFSPNSDGTNDFFKIRSIGNFTNTAITIFNRYGQKVFEDSNMTNDNVWDGTWKGKASPDGTYYYILDLGDGTEIKKGWIQLIR